LNFSLEAYEDDKKNIEKTSPDKEENKDYHRLDEQVNVCLECQEINILKSLKRKILRLSSQATVTHLKKFVALKVFDSIDRYKDVSIKLLFMKQEWDIEIQFQLCLKGDVQG
jgi:polycomb group RING finger protein 3